MLATSTYSANQQSRSAQLSFVSHLDRDITFQVWHFPPEFRGYSVLNSDSRNKNDQVGRSRRFSLSTVCAQHSFQVLQLHKLHYYILPSDTSPC
jgi:hypothetical protein